MLCLSFLHQGLAWRDRLQIVLAVFLLGGLAAAGGRAESPSQEEMSQQRKEAAHRQRRVIFNNDGNDVARFPEDREVTPENVLKLRTTPLADTHVDAIFYNPSTPSFGLVTHATNVFDVRDAQKKGSTNAARPLIEQGNDSLQLMVEFGHANDIELFLSMRMNDIHDFGHGPDRPNPSFSPFKRKHPEYLVGGFEPRERPPFGSWTAVDYGQPEVRDLAYRYLEEVCQNYDVDGIELDFFRNLVLFKSHAWGKEVSDDERDALTQFMHRVHTMTREVSLKRGRPLLISIRVPDSVEYCNAMGIDLERWLEEGLIDLLVVGGDFLLKPWEESVALGHKYNVPVYPCLTYEGRKAPWFEWVGTRSTLESYRARALESWNAGADGIYMFNLFNPKAPHWRELGDPQMLLKLDKVYHGSTVTIKFAHEQMPDGLQFRRLPTLSPEHPETLKPGEPLTTTLTIGEDVLWGKDQGVVPGLKMQFQMQDLDAASDITASINGHRLEGGESIDDWLTYKPQPEWIRQGSNEIQITLRAGREAGPVVKDLRLRVAYED